MRFLAAVLVLIMAAGICLGQERLTLDQSIQIALEKSPVMLKARAEIIAAEGMAGQATAGFLPQLSLNASLGKYYSEPQTMQVDMTGTGSPSAVSFGVDEEADTTSYSASLTQALFTGGKLQSSLAMANKGLEIAKEELRKISEEVKFNVINAYYGVSRAQKFVELSEQSVKMAKTHLDRVNALLKVGMSTKADLLRVEVQVAQAEMGLTKAKQGLEIARNNFNNTLGRDLDARVELAEVKYESAEITIYDYKELLKIAYEDRPDWRQYVLAKQVSEDEVGVAKSGLWPMLSLVGSYDIGSTKYPSYQSDTKTWTAMLSGSWNIFDGTATWNKIKEARAKLDAQKANETSVKRAVALEVKDANFAVQSAKDNLSAARKARELAEENHKIAELRYDSGVGTNLEVIDAQVALTQARTDYLQAQHDLQIAQARINKVVGSKIY
jgi:outer membrane protein